MLIASADKRTEISSGDYRLFEWDHRNRLASVSMYNSSHVLQKKFSYLYDAFDRLVGKRSDTDGNGTINATEAYVYDGDQIVLQFGDDDAADLAASDLTHRYLWGPAVDQLLADEEVTSLTSAGTVSWALGDHLNTVRDVVQYSGGTTSVVNHNEYDSFGNKLSQTSAAHDVVFGHTGRYDDPDTGLRYHHHRWTDAATGRWLSEDPIGFAGGDANLYRDRGNSPTNSIDPSGLFGGPVRVPDPWKPPSAPPKPPLTPDQERLLGLANGDPELEKALRELIDALRNHPAKTWAPWPFATRDRCHGWANETHSGLLDEKFAGRLKGIKIEHWVPGYMGWIPTFEDHSVLIITLPNGKKFYLDSSLYGSSDDHIFFEVPDDLCDKNSQRWKDYQERLRRLHDRSGTGFPWRSPK